LKLRKYGQRITKPYKKRATSWCTFPRQSKLDDNIPCLKKTRGKKATVGKPNTKPWINHCFILAQKAIPSATNLD
jgi:hypothetical protein